MITGMAIDAGASLAPAFMLTLNSQDITSNFSDRLISLTMTDNRGFEADQLDIELDDTDGAYFHERRSLNNFHRDRVITFEQIAE